ncbi:G patch domain and ankyrin repeat-containing protein 1, partial [Entomortierella beljakovae]
MDSKWNSNNKSTRDKGNRGSQTHRLRDDSGTFYRDIAFVPSGNLSIKEATSTKTNNKEDAADVREFYKTVLAMPRTVKATKRKKKQNLDPQTIQPLIPSSLSHPESTKFAKTEVTTATTVSSDSTQPPISTAEEIIRRNWQSNHGSDRIVAEGYILCEPCQIEVREDDIERHRRGTAHLMSVDSFVKPLDALTLGHSNKGFRMLINSGWDYEKGLGADGQGVRHPIATRLKHDRLALGASTTNKKLVTHTFEEITKSNEKPTAKSNRRVLLNAEDFRRQAEKDRRDR